MTTPKTLRDEFAMAALTWREIDSAPKDGTWFLAYGTLHEHGEHVGEVPHADRTKWYAKYEEWYAPALGSWCPTHWMPLPPPPALARKRETEHD